MKFKVFSFFMSLLVFSIAYSEEKVGNSEWKARMQAMLKDVLVLFPYAFDDAKFSDAKNTATIEKSIKSLVEHSSGLRKHTARFKPEEALKIDPSFSFIAEAFQSELVSAQVNFKKTGRSHTGAQVLLRSALAKCILCHSQSANGPELKLNQFKSAFEALSPKDRFLAMAATRQFDEALVAFEKLLDEAKDKTTDKATDKTIDQTILDQTAKAALAIAVRVKKDAKRSLALIEKIANSGAGSSLLQIDLKDWRQSALAWQAEKLATLDSDQALFSEANRLIEGRKKKGNDLEAFENSDVSLLRATSCLHDLLSNFPKSSFRAQAYLLLASTYDMLPGFAIWDLADEYLGACVQEYPHSTIGEKCFNQYSDNVVVGYSGSAGTNIPAAVREHLARMKALAKPAPLVKPMEKNKE